eukprot:CAMPEP_0174309048 /NCGR_PEP_ID=MMETSP0810-20121108/2145_1 /TAXON_ID=73025 ORGANISM="Eutreptiella gymnastica-like, Strain CCMP1594" /NCGR_SAMPLE_ID=MMETSP0810 /ASSEMBLY_ACC=CAM_ASM_000659 /LENGTH=415 /DNA_ID=CAMNT_0015416541 /DNA_START=31 /DNA_END=1275 /DNA_ORIENTATION=+
MWLCPSRKPAAKTPANQQAALLKQLLAEYRLQRLQGTNLERMTISSRHHSWLQSTYGVDMAIVGGTLGVWQQTTMRASGPDPSLPDGVSYSTPSDLFRSVTPVLFARDNGEHIAAHFSDVNQGALGNCWLMAAIAAVARYGVARDCITAASASEVSVRLYQCDGPHSTFATPFTQVVSTQIPTQDGRRPCYVHSDSVGEYWPCMLEKAVAAAHYRTRSGENGYDAQAGGICGIGMGQLLGGFPGVAYGANLSAADLFTAWDYLMAQGITVTCAWNPVSGGPSGTNGEPSAANGLVSSHAYTVIALLNVGGHKLARFRNPWGNQVAGCARGQSRNGAGEWTGTWSDCDTATWDANPEVRDAAQFQGSRRDGCFWMEFADIAANLSNGDYAFFIPASSALRQRDLRPVPGTTSGGGG